jgi:hypothetical protein
LINKKKLTYRNQSLKKIRKAHKISF